MTKNKKFSFIPRAMLGLAPKEEKFFLMFQNMTKIIVQAAELLKAMLDNFENPEKYQQQIRDLEHQGDQQTHEIIQKLNTSFVTPFDREDIYSLASALDDVLDYIDASAAHIVLYKIEKPTESAKELAFIILKCTQAINKAMELLGKELEQIADFCIEVNSLENEGDRIRRAAISDLFENEKDAIRLIKWKDIYEILEKAVDECEDVVNILESMVLKHA
jgi:hypothetical protein